MPFHNLHIRMSELMTTLNLKRVQRTAEVDPRFRRQPERAELKTEWRRGKSQKNSTASKEISHIYIQKPQQPHAKEQRLKYCESPEKKSLNKRLWQGKGGIHRQHLESGGEATNKAWSLVFPLTFWRYTVFNTPDSNKCCKVDDSTMNPVTVSKVSPGWPWASTL